MSHILYFHQHFATPKGAGGNRSYQMARSLVDRGHQVTMVCGSYSGASTGLTTPFISGKREGYVDGIRVIEFELHYSNRQNFGQRIFAFIKFSVRSLKLLFTRKADIVVCTSTPLTVGIISIVARILTRSKVVFEVRDLWPELPKAMKVITNPIILMSMSVLEWASYKTADILIGLSPGISAGIKRKGGKSEKVTTIPNGCDNLLFDSVDVGDRPHNINQSDFLAVFAGTHGVANGLRAIIDAAVVLKQLGRKDIKILLLGDGAEKDRLRDFALQCELQNIIFMEPVAKHQLIKILKSADAGIQCLANIPEFYYGTSPNKFFDYLAASLPVVINYPGWVADLVTETGSGIAVEPDSPTALAHALIDMADNREKMETMSTNAKRMASERFDRGQLATDWCDSVLS